MPRPRRELPDANDPLPTGELPVAPSGRRVVEVPSNSEAIAIIEGTRRKLSDLPVAPRHLNPIACVCLYTMYGLDSQEISVATGIPLDQLNGIRMSNEYAIMQRAVVDSVLETEAGSVKDFIKRQSQKAANRIVAQIDHQNADVSYRASKDILDRAGMRPSDTEEHRKRMDVGLVIEVVEKSRDDGKPIIDMEVD